MKSKFNKRKPGSVYGTFNIGENTIAETEEYCNYFNDEADVTMVFFVMDAAKSGQSVICILSDDTEVFVLVYWVDLSNLQCKVQIACWNISVFDTNATCADIGQ